jgi:hypothetical protein
MNYREKAKSVLTVLFCSFCLPSIAQINEIQDNTEAIRISSALGIEYRIKARVALGGTLPIPYPLKIKEVKSYKLKPDIGVEAEVLKTFTPKWGLASGLQLERKGMKTDAFVQNYHTRLIASDREIEGVWTGGIKTIVSNTYLTLPMLAVWKPNQRWNIKLGPTVSYLIDGNFSGFAYNGYLREGSPIGEKIEIKNAGYSFSSDLQTWNWGVQLGAEWRAFPHLLVGLDVTCGLNSIFREDFKVISSKMYPLYAHLIFGYAF